MSSAPAPAPPPASPRLRESLIVLILAGVQFSHIMDFMVMMPLGPQLMRVYGISPQQFGLVVSVYTFSAAISCFLAALFMDRFDRKHVLITVYSGLVVGTWLCGLAPSFHLLLAARVVTGVFGGLLQAVILAFIGDTVPEQRRGRAIGTVMAAFAMASVVGVPTGLYAATYFGWQSVFLGLGALSAVNLGLAARFLPRVREHLALRAGAPSGVLGGIGELLRRRNTWLAIAVIVTMMTVFGMFPFLSPYLVSVVGVTEAQLPQIYLCGGLASFIVSPLAGRLSDRYGPKRVFALSSVFAVPAVLALSSLGKSTLIMAILLNTLVSAVGAGRMTPAMTLINSSVEKAKRGGFMTLISSVQQLCAALASYGGGWLLGAGGATGAAGMARFPLLGGIVACGMVASTLIAMALRPVKG